jgi:hypothetical protein
MEYILQTLDGFTFMPVVSCGIARMLCEMGRQDEARRVLAPVRENLLQTVPLDDARMSALCHAVTAASLLGDTSVAQAALEGLRPWHGQFCFTTGRGEGAVALYVGLAAAQLGLAEEAELRFTEALDMHRRFGAPYYEALTLLEHGKWLAGSDSPGNRGRGARLIEMAGALATDRGYLGLVRKAAGLR